MNGLQDYIDQLDPALTQLDLVDNRIGNTGAIALAEALKQDHDLTELDLDWNQNW